MVDTAAILGIPSSGEAIPFSRACYAGKFIFWDVIIATLGLEEMPNHGNSIIYQDIFSACEGRLAVTSIEIEQYARTFIFYLMGMVLFPSGREDSHLSFITALLDLDRCRGYDWGSALLSHLFNNLDEMCRSNTSFMSCAWLLEVFFFITFRGSYTIYFLPDFIRVRQIWAYEIGLIQSPLDPPLDIFLHILCWGGKRKAANRKIGYHRLYLNVLSWDNVS